MPLLALNPYSNGNQLPFTWASAFTVLSTVTAISTPPSSERSLLFIDELSGSPHPQDTEKVINVLIDPEDVNVLAAGGRLGQKTTTSCEAVNPSDLISSADITNIARTQDGVYQEDMKQIKTKATIGVLATLISYMSLNSLYRAINPEAFIWYDEDREEPQWMATSKSWLDRKACRWLSICGAAHFHWSGSHFGRHVEKTIPEQHAFIMSDDWDWQNGWTEGKDTPEDWSKDERVLREIPNYIMEYAPLVHLFSGEQFWPCDIAEHLYHITPTLNYTPLPSEWQRPTLKNLDKMNEFEHGRHIFLTSKDNPEERPAWLEGEKNIPNSPPDSGWQEGLGEHFPGSSFFDRDQHAHDGEDQWNADPADEGKRSKSFGRHGRAHVIHEQLKQESTPPSSRKHIRGGRSDAPAVLVVVDKGHGVVDAFWFFFYSFNLGNTVFNVRFGNHVGDWEHSAVRFHNGEPKAVFFSEHNFGSAYSYGAVEKLGKRPIIYSASGSHAMYATSGLHPYVLPWGILHDATDEGPLWDPVLNSHAYAYNAKNNTLLASNFTPTAPTEWFYFAGHWGDKFYPLGDSRQYRFAGQYHYVNGPLGPRFKELDRKRICPGPDSVPCVIKNWLGGSNVVGRYLGPGEGDELSVEDEQRFFGNDPYVEGHLQPDL